MWSAKLLHGVEDSLDIYRVCFYSLFDPEKKECSRANLPAATVKKHSFPPDFAFSTLAQKRFDEEWVVRLAGRLCWVWIISIFCFLWGASRGLSTC
jgi:hypothetical protein